MDTRSFEFYQSRYRALNTPFWGFGLISCLGLLGMFLFMQSRRHLVLISFILFYTAAISLFFIYGRYRLPLIVPLSILGASALYRLAEFISEGRILALFASIATLSVIVWLVYGVVLTGNKVSFFADYYNQGNKYIKLGRDDLAAAEYEKALFIRPGHHPAAQKLYIVLANYYTKGGDISRAVMLLQRGGQAFPENMQIRTNLELLLRSNVIRKGNVGYKREEGAR